MQPTYWKRFDDSVPFAARIDTVVKWLGYRREAPRLVTLYYEEPDSESHGAGPVSDATGKMVEHVDSLIGVLISNSTVCRLPGRLIL
jgi:hypothetical protein